MRKRFLRMPFRTIVPIGLFVVALVMLAGCAASAPATPPALGLSPGNFTPLGGVQKNNQPTPSDLADLQAAENGSLGQPALVEFYADY